MGFPAASRRSGLRMSKTILRQGLLCLLLASLVGLAGCASKPSTRNHERECMARVMYFESNRSSADGMLAVGTVVMNRLKSGKYPTTVCGVVGQKNQFAPGVLSKPMNDRGRELAYKMADQVLAGKRHRGVGRSMFFHTAGYNFPYRNMHYQVVAGGNAFYEKRTPKGGQRNTSQYEVAQGVRPPRPSRPDQQWAFAPPVQVAALAPRPAPRQAPRPAPAAAATATFMTPIPLPPEPASIEELIALTGG
jgi:spore germination cell wall hydrolase CwlJ-like protein